MHRRDLLRSLGASAVLFTFASGVDRPESLSALAAAFHRAARNRRSVLVFVIPADDGDKYIRGQTFGEFLNFGPDDAIARLSEVELVAASMEDVRVLLPHHGDGEPLMVLIDPSIVPAQTQSLHTSLAPMSRFGDTDSKAQVRQRIDAIATLARTHLPKTKDAGPTAEALRSGVLARAIPGSKWAQATGCGFRIEGQSDALMARCGMGHVEPESARMLYFFDVL
ncbi:MAG: hypothetical protein KC912_07660 [Proteobacteria bacterium]|nr:hypothetical protein [Pseudomonadota bacterium]